MDIFKRRVEKNDRGDEMKSALYTLADMKGNNNLKTEEAQAIAKAMGKPTIISRDSVFPFDSLIPKAFTAMNKRNKFIKIMDVCAPIQPVELAVFFPHCFYKTCSFFNQRKSITINFVASGVGKEYSRLEKKEYEKFGMKQPSYNAHALKCALASKYAIVTSNWFKNLLVKEEFPEKNIYMTHLGVNISKFRPGKKKDNTFRVICVADFTPMKGLDYLVNAWKRLNLENAELLLVGRLPIKIKNHIDFSDANVAFIPHTNPVPYYQKSDLLALPSLSEGSSRVMYEAMACGLPVIVTENVGAVIKDRDATFKIVTKDTGRIVPIKNTKALAESILWFYNHQKEMKKMGGKARQHIKRFTWKQYTKRIKKIMSMIKGRENP